MPLLLILILLFLLFGGLGFAVHFLWFVAVVVIIAFAISFFSGSRF